MTAVIPAVVVRTKAPLVCVDCGVVPTMGRVTARGVLCVGCNNQHLPEVLASHERLSDDQFPLVCDDEAGDRSRSVLSAPCSDETGADGRGLDLLAVAVDISRRPIIRIQQSTSPFVLKIGRNLIPRYHDHPPLPRYPDPPPCPAVLREEEEEEEEVGEGEREKEEEDEVEPTLVRANASDRARDELLQFAQAIRLRVGRGCHQFIGESVMGAHQMRGYHVFKEAFLRNWRWKGCGAKCFVLARKDARAAAMERFWPRAAAAKRAAKRAERSGDTQIK